MFLRLGVILCFLLPLLLPACDRPSAPPKPEVVLYTSVDPDFLRPVVEAFRAQTGISVRTATDTEATKTTGLVQRLLTEKDHPRADVWWSSESLGTVRLARAGVLEPYTSAAAESVFPTGWPPHLRGSEKDWYGFAQRVRVIVYSTRRFTPETHPRSLADLTRPDLKGRIGIARPQFGTTRGHMAALLSAHGEPAFEAWLTALRDNGVRLYDGNMSVVRAVQNGEIDAGLTDTDDVFAGQRQGWPVEAAYPTGALAAADSVPSPSDPFPAGPLFIPNTVALVRGGPHPDEARRLLDFLLSADVERMLAHSESRNIPVRPDVYAEAYPPVERGADGVTMVVRGAEGERTLTPEEWNDLARFPGRAVGGKAGPSWEEIASHEEAAMRVCERVLGN